MLAEGEEKKVGAPQQQLIQVCDDAVCFFFWYKDSPLLRWVEDLSQLLLAEQATVLLLRALLYSIRLQNNGLC